ncbi:MAG: hypothetical protein MJ225_01835 [Bacilli bacterium]|nr:hypothetical protein [Bacilli bacterium]
MKTKYLFTLTLLTSLSVLVGCGDNKGTQPIIHQVYEIADHIFEVPKYKTLDEEYADQYYLSTYDKWEIDEPQGGGCSAIKTTLENNDFAVGRNMDLNISNKCAYIVRTDVPHKNSTVGLAYTFRDVSPDYHIVKANKGLEDKFYKLLPFMCDDVLNDKGLYIEINMRNGEYWPTGEDKFACKGTNPYAEKRVYMFELPRYIAENCDDLAGAKEYIKNLNVYSQEHYWNYSFLICDRFGNSSILEFGLNKYYWNDDKICQTNFYLNKECFDIERIYSGLGRYNTLMEGIESVKTESDLYKLMDKVSYYQVYDPYNCQFDPRSENIGALPYLTYELIFDDKYKDTIFAMMDEFGKSVRSLSRQQQMNLNQFWESTFTEVVNISKKTIFVRFFENEKLKAIINLDSTIISNDY